MPSWFSATRPTRCLPELLYANHDTYTVTVHLLSWQNTARFYAQVMDWWMTVKPQLTMDFIEFRYEDAVFQFEPAFRKVFDFWA